MDKTKNSIITLAGETCGKPVEKSTNKHCGGAKNFEAVKGKNKAW